MPETGEADLKKKKEELSQLREKQKKSLAQEREIDIHIRYSPWKILKGSIFVSLLIVAFVLGRITADTSSEPAAAEHSSGVGSFFASLFSGKSSGEVVKAPAPTMEAVTEGNKSEKAAPIENKTTNSSVSPQNNTAAINETSEKTVTTYSHVVATLNDVTVDWKGTWGKITEIDYTIKNNEQGTINPAYFIMTMEGYTDFEKKISVANSIKTGQSDAALVIVPGGFAYNEATAGDLTNVEISLILYDGDKHAMASFKQEFNLKRG